MQPKLLLISLPQRGWDGVIRPLGFPSHGIGYLSAYLKKQMDIAIYGLDTSLDFANVEYNVKQEIAKLTPDLIGITVYSPLADEAEKVIEIIKSTTSIPIVLGGPHISTTGVEFLQKTKVEYGVVKDGERPLHELVKSLFVTEDIASIKNIPGLIYKSESDKYILNPNTNLILGLDEIPFPDFSLFELDNYVFWKNKAYGLLSSRGCPYGCTYCAAPHVTGRKFRFRSPENVVAEIEHYYHKFGFRRFGILDDAFNINLKRAKEVIRLIIKKDLKIKWDLGNGIRANIVDLEFFQLLKQSGCDFVGIGMESGNAEILRSIKKGLKKEQLLTALDYANQCKVGTAVNFIIGHPEETYATALETLEFADKIPASYVNVYGLLPMKGTVAYEQLKEKEAKGEATFYIDYEDYVTSKSAQATTPIFATKDFTVEQRKVLLKN